MTDDNWRDDDVWQRTIRDRILLPAFYRKYFDDVVFVDQSRMTTAERHASVDTIARWRRTGKLVRIEEKIWRAPHTLQRFRNYPLETRSCTVSGHESTGWMAYSPADVLLGAFCNQNETELDVHLLDMPKLKAWFWPRVTDFKLHIHQHTRNRSEARLAPFGLVPPDIVTWRGTVCEPDIFDLAFAARPMGRAEAKARAWVESGSSMRPAPVVIEAARPDTGWRLAFRYAYAPDQRVSDEV
jgi:hypothetical protein